MDSRISASDHDVASANPSSVEDTTSENPKSGESCVICLQSGASLVLLCLGLVGLTLPWPRWFDFALASLVLLCLGLIGLTLS